jgi:hypothetical protein
LLLIKKNMQLRESLIYSFLLCFVEELI